MYIVNPFNRIPETKETMAQTCHCYCTTGSADARTVSDANADIDCHCTCGGGYENKVANYNMAATA